MNIPICPVTNALCAATPPEKLVAVARLTRDLCFAARGLSADEVRFLVDAYYTMQDDRIRAEHQLRTLSEGGEPHDILVWLLGQRSTLEKQVAGALDKYSGGNVVGVWARSIYGIGPIIAAGLLAHIDIEKAPSVGHIWRYAGLDPTVKWEKKTRRPWNADLKRLCYLIGESFVKVQRYEGDVYGKIYAWRKAQETEKNERLDYAEQAKASLAAKRYGEETDARKHYEAGRLPPARIHMRAMRYATKLFLAHYHHVLHETVKGEPPPKPYILQHGGHVDFIRPPNWPMQH